MAMADVRKEPGDERLFRGESEVVEEQDADRPVEPDSAAGRRLPTSNTARASLAARTRQARAARRPDRQDDESPADDGG